MEIPREQAEKLEKYFINSDPFLWGVLENRNKKGRIKELIGLGYLENYTEGTNATYSKINQELLVELGMGDILEHIVMPKVNRSFSQEILRYFTRCWDQGQTPDIKYLKERKLYHSHLLIDNEYEGTSARIVGHKDPAHIFVQIDTQHNFVERWTVFAGLWFEEIEPLLEID